MMNLPQNIISHILLSYYFVSSQVIVTLPDGKIQGNIEVTRTNVHYNSFYGVRYAKSPTNELRFKPPQPLEPWSDIFNATVEKGICYQTTADYDYETEDCLFLNLYTPVLDLTSENPREPLPVLLYIHGGGFVEGSALLEWGVGPKFLVEYDVILIAINYRVGPFGYMSTGDDNLPGNLGMKDQLAALHWVQKNIKYFGGDPDKVTVFGQSAGAASVSYLLLSPLAEGLFRGAILESGSALNPWAYQRNQTEITYNTAALLDSRFETNRNSTELLEFLQSIPAKQLDEASYNLTIKLESNSNDYQLSKGFYYTPVIEHEHDNAFLTQLQYEGYKNGNFLKVPIILGFNAEESLFMTRVSLTERFKDYDEHPNYLVPFDFHLTNESKILEIGKMIKEYYSPGENFVNNELGGVQYHSNQDFDKAIIKQAILQSSYAPVYFYEFTYSGKMGNDPFKLNGSGAVTHGEEMKYIFSASYSEAIPDNTDLSQFPETDIQVHYRFMKLFTNFAKYLNPTPLTEEILQNITWPVLKSENFTYLEIGKDLILHASIPKIDMVTFWDNLYETYAVTPYDTY